MIIYEKVFPKVNGDGLFPKEDFYYIGNNKAIIADGITRDPIGILNLEEINGEISKFYPRPSGAAIAANTVVETLKNTKTLTLLEMYRKANKKVKEINEKYNGIYDYLENDYYGTVSSSVWIKENFIEYAYIGDCGIILMDKNRNIKFESTNDVKEAKKHFDTKGIPWSNKEARKWIRKNYRNNKCEKYSYGALTGEESALLYLKAGILKKEKGDIIILYSDGFYPFLKEKFFEVILTKDKSKIDLYIENKIKQNKKIYGEEKTILILEID